MIITVINALISHAHYAYDMTKNVTLFLSVRIKNLLSLNLLSTQIGGFFRFNSKNSQVIVTRIFRIICINFQRIILDSENDLGDIIKIDCKENT